MQLHFREYGDGPPLIVLHGLFGSLDNLHPVSQKLSSHFHVFAVDQRNHGQSPHHPEMNYAAMAGDLREFMEQQSLIHVHLVGHSMGGKTAMQFALSFPEKTLSLVVVDIAPRAYPPDHEPIFKALLSLDLSGYQTRQQIENELAGAIPEIGVRRFLLKNLARDSSGKFHWRLNLPVIFRNYPALNGPIEGDRPFRGPALFVRGEKSDYIRDSDEPLIQRMFPRAEVQTISGAGHWIHAEAPGVFLETLENFLARHAIT